MSLEDRKKVVALQKELVDLLLKKANIRKKSLYETAISSFVNDNLDLLSSAELKKYRQILLV
jgi:hypothetical protein